MPTVLAENAQDAVSTYGKHWKEKARKTARLQRALGNYANGNRGEMAERVGENPKLPITY